MTLTVVYTPLQMKPNLVSNEPRKNFMSTYRIQRQRCKLPLYTSRTISLYYNPIFNRKPIASSFNRNDYFTQVQIQFWLKQNERSLWIILNIKRRLIKCQDKYPSTPTKHVRASLKCNVAMKARSHV